MISWGGAAGASGAAAADDDSEGGAAAHSHTEKMTHATKLKLRYTVESLCKSEEFD